MKDARPEARNIGNKIRTRKEFSMEYKNPELYQKNKREPEDGQRRIKGSNRQDGTKLCGKKFGKKNLLASNGNVN